MNNVNVTNIHNTYNTVVNNTVINNYYNNAVVNKNVTVNNSVHYMNQGVPGAVTATSHESFTSAQPVARNLVHVNQKEMESAPVAASAPAIVPPKQAVLGAGRATNVHPPINVQNRAVVAKTAPPPPPPPFQQRQAAIQANQGRPISQTQARQLEPEHSAANAAPVRIAPVAASHTYNKQTGGNHPNDPGPLNTNRPPNAAGDQVNQSAPHGQSSQSGQGNPNTPSNPRTKPNLPPSSRQNTVANPQLEEKHQQQLQQLQQKQDQEYQKLQQKQQQQDQKLQQKNADEGSQRQSQQQQQEKLQQLEQKHNQQQQVLEHKQAVEHTKAPPAPKPKPDEKDKPHH